MSFERKLWLGYLLVAATIGLLAVLGTRVLRDIVVDKDGVIFDNAADVLAVDRLRLASEKKSRQTRAFLLTGSEASLTGARAAGEDEASQIEGLRKRLSPPSLQLLERAIRLNAQYDTAREAVVKLRHQGEPAQLVASTFEREAEPLREELDSVLDALGQREDADLQAAMAQSVKEARTGAWIVTGFSSLAVIVAALLGFLLLRTLRELKLQRRLSEEQLERLARSNEDLDAFAARVAHDVRSVLAPLPMTVAQLKRVKTEPADAATRIGERIYAVTRRAAAMMDALLAFSRGGKIGDGLTNDSSAEAVLGQVLDDLRPRAEDLEVTVDAQLEEVHLAVPPELLYIVALNLLNNALKFTAGRPVRQVRIRSGVRDGVGTFAIEDTGPGIPADSRREIFKPFFRARGTRAPGTGIGLATVERIVAAHGGTIDVDSEEGKGTRMTVRLPLAEKPRGEWEPPPGPTSTPVH